MTKVNNMQKGFSLIELSIGLLLVGLFAGTALQQWHAYETGLAVAKTKALGSGGPIAIAIQKYYLKNNRLPCPADPALSSTDPNAGVEVTGPNCSGGSVVPATGAGGVKVAEGSVPYTTLNNGDTGGLQVEDSIDGWGRKLAYFVSVPLVTAPISQAALSLPANLGVTVYQPTPDPASPTVQLAGAWNPPSLNPYVVFSYGSDGRGGYTNSGILYAFCTGVGIDLQNCLGTAGNGQFYDVAFIPDPKTGLPTLNIRSLNTASASFYDDYLLEDQVNTDNDNWSTADAASTMFGPGGNIGINNQLPKQAIDVGGDIQADQVNATSYCHIVTDTTTTPPTNNLYCFKPSVIAGPVTGLLPGMACQNDAPMGGFSSNLPKCPAGTLGFTPPNPGDCSSGCSGPPGPLGKCYVTGIDSTGSVICGPF